MTPQFKQKPLRDRKYLDWLKTQPCVLTGIRPSESEGIDPAHIGTAGKGVKSPDNEALPILHGLHVKMHNEGELKTLRAIAPDWLLRKAFRAYAREMYEEWRN